MDQHKVFPQKVLILMATFNGADFLLEQITSILQQASIDLTLLVSDDSSEEIISHTIKSVALANQKITLLPKVKSSGSAAQNFFRLFRDTNFEGYDFIALSDQDDIWLPTKLSHAVHYIDANRADAYSSNVTAFWANGQQKLINKAQPQRAFDYMFESAGPGCTFVLTQKLAFELQGFLINHQQQCQHVALHDWFIYAYARSHGFKWVIDDESHMLYRQHHKNVVGANVGLRALLVRFKKMRAGWLRAQALLLAQILGYSDTLPMMKLMHNRWSDRVWLICHVTHLRRRLLDRVALALFLLISHKKKIISS